MSSNPGSSADALQTFRHAYSNRKQDGGSHTESSPVLSPTSVLRFSGPAVCIDLSTKSEIEHGDRKPEVAVNHVL